MSDIRVIRVLNFVLVIRGNCVIAFRSCADEIQAEKMLARLEAE